MSGAPAASSHLLEGGLQVRGSCGGRDVGRNA